MNAGRVLIVEDEPSLAKGMAYNFEKRDYEVVLSNRGDEALALASSQEFDLILLDVMLPGKDGFEICSELRARRIHTPILMLTARHEIENRLKGLKLGADDYLGKPFHLDELIARVESLIRRRAWERQSLSPSLYQLRELSYDCDRLELRGKKKAIHLTAMEAKLLELLLQEQGKAVSRTRILKEVWGLHEETQTRSLDNFIMRLRHHLERCGGSAQWIESVRAIGYRFVETDEL